MAWAVPSRRAEERESGAPKGPARFGPACLLDLALDLGVRGGLLRVLGLRVLRLGRLADDALARAVGVGRRGVGDDVDRVEQRGVVAVAARDQVDLAVAGAEGVVAGAAVEGVAALVDLAVGAGVDVTAGQRPQGVVAVPAVGRVVADVGEDGVVAVTAVLDVVAGAAVHAVVAVLAVGDVVAGTAGDAVVRVAAEQLVVARAAEDAVEGGQVAGAVDVADHRVVARAAVEPVVALHAADGVVAAAAEDAVVARAADELVVAGEAVDAVVARVAVDVIGGVRPAQVLAAWTALDGRGESASWNEGERGGGADE